MQAKRRVGALFVALPVAVLALSVGAAARTSATLALTPASQSSVLLRDNFNRPNSTRLGPPWTQEDQIGCRRSPCSRIEVSSNAMGFHYKRPAPHKIGFPPKVQPENSFPYAYAPLATAVDSYPVTLSFTLTPHADERTSLVAGLMTAGSGFIFTAGAGSQPKDGLAVSVGRSAKTYNNSTIEIVKRQRGVQSTLASKALAFQLESGTTYSVKFTVNADYSTTVTINSASLSAGSPVGFTPVLDQAFFADSQGGISFDSDAGDYILRIDNVLVTSTGDPPLPDALVDIGKVSNGCGGGKAGKPGWLQKFGSNTSTYLNSNDPTGTRYTVNFSDACDLHDAGYSGAKVRDKINGGIIDYLERSKVEVDKKFWSDMQKLCLAQIPATAPVARNDCLHRGGKTSFGSESRYIFVRDHGDQYYRKRPRLTGHWHPEHKPKPVLTVAMAHRTVTANWKTSTGGSATFRGTLITYDEERDDIVKGFVKITEGDEIVRGAATIHPNFIYFRDGIDVPSFLLSYDLPDAEPVSTVMRRR